MTETLANAADPARPRLAALTRGTPPARRHRRWAWWLAAAALVAAAAALWTTRKTEVQASNVMTAYPSAQHALLTASGYVVAQRRAAVSSKATGRLIELRVREGSPVKEGELIGRLDASDVLAAMQAAQAGQRQAEATLQQAEAGVRQAQVERANAEAELQRVLELRAQGFVSPQAVDTARRRTDAARAGEASAQAGIAAARGNIAAAAAQVQVQAVNRANTEIRAPFDGVVLVKNANVGDMITPFSSAAGAQGAVVTMADMGTLEVEADVSESNVGQITIDMPVEITLDALPETRFRGSVVRIVPTVDRAKATVMTKVRFDQLDPRVLPEMSAKVVFLKQRPTEADLQPVLAVNPRTVVQREGRPVVLRIANGEVLEAVPVTPGRTLGDLLEVQGGALKSGEQLVLTPGNELQSGARVAVAGK
ncbi:MAG: efflux RND transporter periplasmic adaptor subunit [Rubrivivax sp.]|nr:efflux RND transporter periplasmic adaptor subunit [Rubrivivax sp.]